MGLSKKIVCFPSINLRYRSLIKIAGVIHSIDFHRLILDEAHSIKVITLYYSLIDYIKISGSHVPRVSPALVLL